MKRTSLGLLPLLLIVVVLGLAAPATAHDYDPDNSDFWIRYVAYALHPLGYAMEFCITRPAHYIVSQPYLNIVFGHDPRTPRDERYVYRREEYWDTRLPW